MDRRYPFADEDVRKRRLVRFVFEWVFLGNHHFVIDTAKDVRTVQVEVEGVLYLWQNRFCVAALFGLQKDSLVNYDFVHVDQFYL
jgi:hypothetical protein